MKYGSGRTRREAEANANKNRDEYERKIRQRAYDLLPSEQPAITVRQWAEQHLEAKEYQRRKTREKYQGYIRDLCQWCDPTTGRLLGELPMASVSYVTLTKRMNQYRRDHADSTACLFQAWVKSLWRRALNLGFVPRNPAQELEPIPMKCKTTPPPTDAEWLTMHSFAADERMRAALIFMYYGCRISEILGLTADCIDGNKIHIRQQLGRVDDPKSKRKTALAICPPKAGTRPPLVLSDQEMRVIMRSLDSARPTVMLDATQDKERTSRSVAFVVPAPKGGAWSDSAFRPAFKRLQARSGVSFNPHEYRAQAITDTISGEGGYSPQEIKAVSRWMGHEKVETTQERYNRIRSSVIDGVNAERTSRLRGLLSGEAN